MNNRDTLLSIQFPPATSTEPFLELDLRDIYTNVLLGRRSQLQVMTKLVFKGSDEYRKDQSVFQLWADVRVQGQDGVPLSIGRAVIPEPVFFGPPSADSFAAVHRDPWTRAGQATNVSRPVKVPTMHFMHYDLSKAGPVAGLGTNHPCDLFDRVIVSINA
jgi:hypothetical protein